MAIHPTPVPAAMNARRAATASLIGTTLEWYDFFIYGTAAALVFNKLFFPAYDATVGTLAALATFGVGFAARPVGGLICGHFGDRIGRKTTLIATLLLMGAATLAIGLLPTYAVIGVWSPVLLVALRLVQGLAIGGEWGGAVLMAVEHAPAHRRGFYGSWPQIGVPLGLILATGVTQVVSANTDDAAFLAWGWRVPFLISAVLILIGLVMRLKLTESPDFERLSRAHQDVGIPVVALLRTAKTKLALVIGSQTVVNVGFYLLTVYSLSYATSTGSIARGDALTALVVGAIADLVALPLWAALSDRVGRKPLLIGGYAFLGLFAFPFFWLAGSGSPVLLALGIALGLAFGHAPAYAASASFIAEAFPAEARYTGVSLAYQLAGVISSGPTPIIAGALVAAFGGGAPVAVMLMLAAVVSIVCLLPLAETRNTDHPQSPIPSDRTETPSVT